MSAPDVAFDLTPLQNGHRFRGIGTYVRGLANRLAAQRDVTIEFWAWNDEPSLEVLPPHTLRPMHRPFLMPEYRGAWLFARFAMSRAAETTSARAVHLTDPDGLTPLRNRKLMATVYDLIPLKEGISPRRPFVWAGYRTYLRNLRRAAVLFPISHQTATDLQRLMHIPPESLVVARPGIDLRPAPAASSDQARRPYFLFIGGPNPNKNLSLVLHALALSPDLPEELLVSGRWLRPQLAELDAQLRDLNLTGRVRHVGFVASEEVPRLMRNATALVIPSRDEGFGLPAGEGLAAGAAVLHSRIPVLEEVSAGAALTFDPSNAEELATSLRRISADSTLRENLRARGRLRASQLTWDEAIASTLAAYRRILDS